MPRYRHTQRGTLVVVALGLTIAMLVVIGAQAARGPAVVGVALLLTFAVMVAALWLFHSLTVEIADGCVRLWFGPGWIRRSFALERIRSAAPVRNKWYYGWGIRYTPHGWLFNVSGLDAVEIALDDGRTYRIGTDEPDRLAAEIEIRRAAAADAAGRSDAPRG